MMRRRTLLQSMAKRHAVIEHETFAAPAALRLRHAFEISENAALEMIDLLEAAREQIGAGLFAADAAGAEHRDLAMSGRIEMTCDKIPELSKAADARVKRAHESAHRDLERVAGVEHQGVRPRDQRVPVGGLDIDAGLPSGIQSGGAEGDDLFFQPDFQTLERHRRGVRELQFGVVEAAAEQRRAAQFPDEMPDSAGCAR